MQVNIHKSYNKIFEQDLSHNIMLYSPVCLFPGYNTEQPSTYLQATCSGVSSLLSLQLGLTSRSSIKYFTVLNAPLLYNENELWHSTVITDSAEHITGMHVITRTLYYLHAKCSGVTPNSSLMSGRTSGFLIR